MCIKIVKDLFKDMVFNIKITMSSNSERLGECSLTAPEDRQFRDDPSKRWKPDQSVPPLTTDQTMQAVTDLVDSTFVSKYPMVDRSFVDPPIMNQNLCLLSFIPAKGSKPNEKGIYGFAKVRGSYNTIDECDQRSEYLIRNVDSYNKIFYGFVGRPFPVTNSSDFTLESKEVDMKAEAREALSENVKKIRGDERKEMEAIKTREQNLLDKSRKEEESGDEPFENYVMLCVKKAQLSWTYLEHQKKLEEVRDIIMKTRQDLKDIDVENPDFRERYYDKFMKARKDAGFEDTEDSNKTNFIAFMVEDAELPGIDLDYNVLAPVRTPVETSTTTNVRVPTLGSDFLANITENDLELVEDGDQFDGCCGGFD